MTKSSGHAVRLFLRTLENLIPSKKRLRGQWKFIVNVCNVISKQFSVKKGLDYDKDKRRKS